MSLLDTLRKHLTPEQLTEVQDALGDDFNYDVVPRSRLNKVIRQRDEAKQMLTQLQTGRVSDPEEDEDDGEGAGIEGAGKKGKASPGGLTQQMLNDALAQQKAAHEQEMLNLRLQYAALQQLQEAQFVDPQLVWDANLVDKTKLSFDTQGKLAGLTEQLDALKTSKPYLVGGGTQGAPNGTGRQGGEPGGAGGAVTKEDFLKMSYQDRLAFKEANPETFKHFLQQ